MIPSIHRVTVTLSSVWLTVNGVSATAAFPMLEPWTKLSWVRSMRLSRISR